MVSVKVDRDVPFDADALLVMIEWMGREANFPEQLWQKLRDMAGPVAYPVQCFESEDPNSPEYKGFWIEGINLEPVAILLIDNQWVVS